ncbi:MAG: 5-(carboxyamino)imidazole ribonucleotide synthase [Boseongicola sp.]
MTELKQLYKPLPPNSTIGIIGGGQLARMLASSAAKLGFRTIVLEPQENFPAAQLCNRQIVGAYDDETALAELIEACDVVTYEFENVPLSAAHYIETRRPLYPPSEALRVSQDRLVEKDFLRANGVGVVDYRAIESIEDLRTGLKEFDGGVLKTRRFGYDGKGQHVFSNSDVTDDIRLEATLNELGGSDCVLEKLVDFEFEFSIIAFRGQDKSVSAFWPSENIHESGILRKSSPAVRLSDELHSTASRHIGTILGALNYKGVLGVEFFAAQNAVLVNEIAPRVHNSGHWTVEVCAKSQFDAHILAITGLKGGNISPRQDYEMINLLGHEADDIAEYLDTPDTYVTLYGKLESRPGRKMGHLTRLLKR